MKRMKEMKTLFNIIGVLGFALILWSGGENVCSSFSDMQAFLIGIVGVAMLVIGIEKGGVKK